MRKQLNRWWNLSKVGIIRCCINFRKKSWPSLAHGRRWGRDIFPASCRNMRSPWQQKQGYSFLFFYLKVLPPASFLRWSMLGIYIKDWVWVLGERRPVSFKCAHPDQLRTHWCADWKEVNSRLPNQSSSRWKKPEKEIQLTKLLSEPRRYLKLTYFPLPQVSDLLSSSIKLVHYSLCFFFRDCIIHIPGKAKHLWKQMVALLNTRPMWLSTPRNI